MKARVQIEAPEQRVTVTIKLVGTLAEIKEVREEIGSLQVGVSYPLYDALDDALKGGDAS